MKLETMSSNVDLDDVLQRTHMTTSLLSSSMEVISSEISRPPRTYIRYCSTSCLCHAHMTLILLLFVFLTLSISKRGGQDCAARSVSEIQPSPSGSFRVTFNHFRVINIPIIIHTPNLSSSLYQLTNNELARFVMEAIPSWFANDQLMITPFWMMRPPMGRMVKINMWRMKIF